MIRTFIAVVACIGLVACKSPPAEDLNSAAIIEGLEQRALEPEVMEVALSLLERPSLSPDLELASFSDANQADFWQASALLHEPGLRAARRELEFALGREGSAGQPGPIGLSGRTLDLNDLNRDAEVSGSIDLLGLLGLGPSAAASDLAVAQVRQAQASIEEAAWRAHFAVDLVRLACAKQVGLRDALAEHLQTVERGMDRFRALEVRGRLPAAAQSRARAHARLLSQELARAEADLADRRSDLAQLVGLLPEHPMLPQLSAATIRDLDQNYVVTATPGRIQLLEQHPLLRRLRLDYAISEAALRRAVAEAWPTIRLGPRGKISPDDFLTGGLIDFSIPWPGSTNGNVDAALARRARSREIIEEAFVAVLNRAEAARTSQLVRDRAFREDAEVALNAATTTWQGMQARFSVNESAWDLWTDALALKTNAIREYWRMREDELRSRILLARELAMAEKKQ